MNLRKILQRSHIYFGVEQEFQRIHTLMLRLKARWVIGGYLGSNSIRKLQIGAGPTQSAEWLTTDIDAKLRRRTLYLDATRPFPIPDASIDYVFSEHMIEHIPYAAGLSMLKECHRILKSGGKVRLATPDLGTLLDLKKDNLSELQREYIAWNTKTFLPPGTPVEPIFVINNQFRNYGHQFLFDEACLREALARAGFGEIRRMPVGESDDEHLRGVEKHGLNMGNESMNAFESMVLEATRA